MNVRLSRRWLWTASAAGLVAGVMISVWAFLPPPADVPLKVVAVKLPAAGSSASPEVTLPPLAELRRLATLPLRQPLYDPPPPKLAPAPPLPPLTVKFEGSIIEPGKSRAMFSTRDGQYLLKRVGEMAGEAEVLAITSDSVTLRYGGREIVLTAKPDTPGSSVGGGTR